MRELGDTDFERIQQDALERCFKPADPRPQCKRRKLTDPPPQSHARWLEKEGKEWNAPYHFWQARQKEAFDFWERNHLETCEYDAEMATPCARDDDPERTIEAAETALAVSALLDSFTDTERRIADLLGDGSTQKEAHEQTGATFYRIEKVARCINALRREANAPGNKGCYATASEMNYDDISLEPAAIDSLIDHEFTWLLYSTLALPERPLTTETKWCDKYFDGCLPPWDYNPAAVNIDAEIQACLRDVEQRKIEIAEKVASRGTLRRRRKPPKPIYEPHRVKVKARLPVRGFCQSAAPARTQAAQGSE
jgi:hypothetical protein